MPNIIQKLSLLMFVVNSLVGGTSAIPEVLESAKQRAETQALVGRNYLHLRRLSDAQIACDSAIKSDPANQKAKQCLDEIADMLVDHDLNDADAEILSGHKQNARSVSAKWTRTHLQRQRARAWDILARTSTTPQEWFRQQTPDWLRQLLLTGFVLTAAWLLLLVIRLFWRKWKRGGLSKSTQWNMYPLKEVPADTQTGIATSLVLDALGRLGNELARPLWGPKLLLLRPTPPADFEPAIIDDFMSGALPSMTFAPSPKDLCGEWKLHDVQLDEAVQNLQIKTSAGVDLGSVARLIRSIFEWFKAGAPVIRGVARTARDEPVYVHLTASGGRLNSAAVTATTDPDPGLNAIQLTAERAAFKFLFRMRYPELTTDEIDGFAALRQGVTIFSQYAGTVAGAGNGGTTRTSSLTKAAFNFNFFRASIPLHCNPVSEANEEALNRSSGDFGHPSSIDAVNGAASNLASRVASARSRVLRTGLLSLRRRSRGTVRENRNEKTSLQITEGMRQAILLAEGVAHALVASASEPVPDAPTTVQANELKNMSLARENYTAAIGRFRQLEDWPGSANTQWLQMQGAYNEAIVWRQIGAVQRSVLMLTQLLDEKAPDTQQAGATAQHVPCSGSKLPEPICFCARVARLSGLAQYTLDDWGTFPGDRAKLIISDGSQVLRELDNLRDTAVYARDQRLAGYLYSESVRALGHVQLMCVKTGAAKDLYRNGRFRGGTLTQDGREMLEDAVKNLDGCDRITSSCSVYCDLSEAYLLLGEWGKAQGYARHATLGGNVQEERAFFLAAESAFLQNKPESTDLARKYAQAFKGIVTLEEFKSLRAELGMSD